MRTLDAIALDTGTDKGSRGHDYCHVYESLLWPLRDESVTLLEIGVWEGASMAMWREYFSSARIVGVDVDMGRVRDDYIDGTHIRMGDASDEAFIHAVIDEFGDFDVVIDDGSHLAPIAQRTFGLLWSHMRADGLYCIEDLHTYWWPHANAAGCEEWLLDLARDALGRGDSRQGEMTHPTDIESVTFSYSMAVVRKCMNV